MSEKEVAAFVARAEGHVKGCSCDRCVPGRAIVAAVANRVFESCLEHGLVARDQIAADIEFSNEVAEKAGVDRERVTALIETFPVDQLSNLAVGVRTTTGSRHPSTNAVLRIDTVTSLTLIEALAAAQRAGKWNNIKALSGSEAEAFLQATSELAGALPAVVEQLKKRVQVSIRQGQHSLNMKRQKRVEREAATRAGATKDRAAKMLQDEEAA
jgi:hypothetical protein